MFKISKGPWRWVYTNWKGYELKGDKGTICYFGNHYPGEEPDKDDQIAIASVPDLIEVFKMAKIVCEIQKNNQRCYSADMILEDAVIDLGMLIEKFEELHVKVEAQNDYSSIESKKP